MKLKPPRTRSIKLAPPRTRAIAPEVVAEQLGGELVSKREFLQRWMQKRIGQPIETQEVADRLSKTKP